MALKTLLNRKIILDFGASWVSSIASFNWIAFIKHVREILIFIFLSKKYWDVFGWHWCMLHACLRAIMYLWRSAPFKPVSTQCSVWYRKQPFALVCKKITGFNMKHNTGLKWVKGGKLFIPSKLYHKDGPQNLVGNL